MNLSNTKQHLQLCSGSNSQVEEGSMKRWRRGCFWFLSTSLLTLLNWALLQAIPTVPHFHLEPVFAASPNESAGSLEILGKDGSAPALVGCAGWKQKRGNS